jgi:hypothetical protein
MYVIDGKNGDVSRICRAQDVGVSEHHGCSRAGR